MSNSKESITLWKDSGLFNGTELLMASCYEHSYPPHFHDEFVIAAFSRGAQKNSVCRKTGVATAGSVMVIHPGEVHTGEAMERNEGWDYCALYPSEQLLLDITYDSGNKNRSLNFGVECIRKDVALASALVGASKILLSSHDPLEKECTLYDVLSRLVSRYGEFTKKNAFTAYQRQDVLRGIEYLQDLYSHSINIKDVAHAAGMSEYYFMRVFRASTGMSVHQYLNQIRLNRAKQSLSEGMSASQVAQSVGFFDQSHLIKAFKVQFGLTPRKYSEFCR
ncbi:AraC family transcriptional regulator [Erwinia sp. S63]|uniref:AraC family transcriptional regulator n=1 Tax=Erwinia sp. S63 TaxID=2769341 RepID=UPI001909C350|nr:AraC family transcriptional regulator [Erwinia sp. S63]MBK0095443.1 AraC family transcriptional regulator [Erwinia sp. S63]